MYSETKMSIEAGLFLLMFFVIVPLTAASIGYAAWKGKPKNFSRDMYWTVFAATTVVSLSLMMLAQQMHADIRTWLYPVQIACFGLGALLFGVAGGCMIGIFTHRRGVKNQESRTSQLVYGWLLGVFLVLRTSFGPKQQQLIEKARPRQGEDEETNEEN
jgi:hypothetical protein